jgi:hypothetical protein
MGGKINIANCCKNIHAKPPDTTAKDNAKKSQEGDEKRLQFLIVKIQPPKNIDISTFF